MVSELAPPILLAELDSLEDKGRGFAPEVASSVVGLGDIEEVE